MFARQARLDFAERESRDPTVFFTDNSEYPALDAWVLEALLRHLRPRHLIEIGSGYSSLVTARVNREYLNGALEVTCVDPDPPGFLHAGVPGISSLRLEKAQDVPLELYERLTDGDVLFVDSSHAVRTGGDVPWIYHEILPRLAPGVLVHLHDIFLPRDYPERWVLDGRGWNEQYLVHSFLIFNTGFEVAFANAWMIDRHRDELEAAFPGYAAQEQRDGTSLWIRRRGGRPLMMADRGPNF